MSGKRPFQGMNDVMVIMAIVKGQLPEKPVSREMNKDESRYPALWTTCGRCWERDPKDRPLALDLVGTMVRVQKRPRSCGRDVMTLLLIGTSCSPIRNSSIRCAYEFHWRCCILTYRLTCPCHSIAR